MNKCVSLLKPSGYYLHSSIKSKMTNTKQVLNVLGGLLDSCSCNPMTGYFRDGFCNTTPDDFGTHVVCAVVTKAFLEYSFS